MASRTPWGLLSRAASSGMGQKERNASQSGVARRSGSNFPLAMRGSWDPWDCSHCDVIVFSGLVLEPDPRLSHTSLEPRDW